ncbi:MAG: hypothetical protein JXJ04_18575 [Spirochaetales bacterium]|nr:hypothetical protein [Spirochaetales bacterium]
MSGEEELRSFINVNLSTLWDNIPVTRRYIEKMIHNETGAMNAKILSAGVSELMENACKYSCYKDSYINVNISRSQNHIKIQVQNIAAAEEIELLKKGLYEVSQGDPAETYKQMMLKDFTKETKRGKLGLARIRYECDGDIHLGILDTIPEYLVSPDKVDDLHTGCNTARAINVSIVAALNYAN